MPKTIDLLEKMLKKRMHVMYHGDLYCREGHGGYPYYYTDESIMPEKNKKLIRCCPMCCKKFEGKIKKTKNQYMHIVK